MLVARLLVAKMAAEHPEPPKGELQLPPPPPPGHYGAWAAQELQAKLAEIGAPIQGSREELVERLQTYTRQVSVVAGVQGRSNFSWRPLRLLTDGYSFLLFLFVLSR